MANNYAPTTVQPDILRSDITPFELRLLEGTYESYEYEEEGTIYFHAEEGANLFLYLEDKDEIKEVLDLEGIDEYPDIKKELEEAEDDCELDDIPDAKIFQNIVKRSKTLKYIFTETAYYCDRMRPREFGGHSCFVTADKIEHCSTSRFIDEHIDEVEAEEPAA